MSGYRRIGIFGSTRRRISAKEVLPQGPITTPPSQSGLRLMCRKKDSYQEGSAFMNWSETQILAAG